MATRTIAKTPLNTRFSPAFSGVEARRQFRISLGLVVILSASVVSAGVAVGGHPLSAKRDAVASRAPVTLMHAETNVAGAKPI